jgi:hypothetical protein
MPMPQIIPPRLTVVPLDDPVVERHGFGPNSVYVELTGGPVISESSGCLRPGTSDCLPSGPKGSRSEDGSGGRLPDRFVVRAWVDPVVESHGFPVSSAYTETVLVPILGPSATFALRRLGTWAAAQPEGLAVDTAELASDLGLGHKGGRHSTMARTISRLCQFGMAQWRCEELAVRIAVAPVSERQLVRLSARVVATHRSMVRLRQGAARRVGSAP